MNNFQRKLFFFFREKMLNALNDSIVLKTDFGEKFRDKYWGNNEPWLRVQFDLTKSLKYSLIDDEF
jgi:hypothetical protein